MKASLEIRLHASAGGRVDASGRLAAAPLWCRWDGDTLWIVGSAASPVGQDDVSIRFEVGAGVHARVRTVAAMVLYAARGTGSSLHTDIRVGPRASLHWAPEPVIVTGRADHRSTTLVEVAAGSRVTVDELVVDGRNDGDRGGRLVAELGLTLDGATSLRSSYDTTAPGWNGPGGTDGARCLATRLAVGHAAEAAPDGIGAVRAWRPVAPRAGWAAGHGRRRRSWWSPIRDRAPAPDALRVATADQASACGGRSRDPDQAARHGTTSRWCAGRFSLASRCRRRAG